MLIILATILSITTPTGTLSPRGSLIYLGVFRILLGIGVGGDYPMSATVTSDRANLRRRGTMLAYIFANQGWGSFVGALVTIIVLACYKSVMQAGETSKVDGGGHTFCRSMCLRILIHLLLGTLSLANRHRHLPRPGIRHTLSATHTTRIHSLRAGSTPTVEPRGRWSGRPTC
jgi:MFS family permease